MFTNTKEVELYDLTYEYSSTLKKKKKKKKHQFMIFLNKWMNAFHMKKHNDEQRLIVDDTIYIKNINFFQNLSTFS
jgi:uncharacterized protein YqiB (DUF1249 family)